MHLSTNWSGTIAFTRYTRCWRQEQHSLPRSSKQYGAFISSIRTHSKSIMRPNLLGGLRDEALRFTEHRPGDSGFFALLGCANGEGVVRMLTDHCNVLGRRSIACVRVLKDIETKASL